MTPRSRGRSFVGLVPLSAFGSSPEAASRKKGGGWKTAAAFVLLALLIGGIAVYQTVQLDSAQASNASLSSQSSSQASQIQSLGSATSSLSSASSSLSSASSSLSSASSSLSSLSSSQLSEIESLKTQASALQSNVSSLEQTVSTLQDTVATLNQNNSAYRTSVQSLQAVVASLDANISSSQSLISSLKTQLSQMVAEVASLNQNITSSQAQVASLSGQVASLQSEVSQLQSSLATLKTELAILSPSLTGTSWSALWTVPGGADAEAAAVDSAGNVYVVGNEFVAVPNSQSVSNALILKYSPKGALLWQEVWQTTDPSVATAAVVAPDGNLYVAGSIQNESGAFLLKFDTSGTLEWAQTFSVEGSVVFFNGRVGLAASASGVYLSGATGLGATLIKVGFNGNVVWSTVWYSGEVGATEVAVAPDGNLFVTGFVVDSPQQDTMVASVDPNGSLAWERIFGGPGVVSMGESVAVGPDGSAYIAGWGINDTTEASADLVMRVSAAGVLDWDYLYSEPSLGSMVGQGVAVSSAGNVYVVGYLGERQGQLMSILQLSEFGQPVGQTYWGVGGSAIANGVTIATNSSFLVVGFSQAVGNFTASNVTAVPAGYQQVTLPLDIYTGEAIAYAVSGQVTTPDGSSTPGLVIDLQVLDIDFY